MAAPLEHLVDRRPGTNAAPSGCSLMSQSGVHMALNTRRRDTSAAETRRSVVLVVEDEVLLRLAISETLRDAGYHVLEAGTSEEAMVLLASYEVALLFTDIQLDGALNGAALARLARRHRPGVVVVATSGVDEPSGLDSDVTFIRKPYAPEQIVDLVNERLN